MWTLGIDTSGRAGSVALLEGSCLIEQRELSAAGRRHARSLVPEIADVLNAHGKRVQDLNLVAVSFGPGSFTGLRVGVVCAKTLGYAVPGLKLVGVDTFLAVAESVPEGIDRLAVFDDALREEVFAGTYRRVAGNWEVEQGPRLQSFQEWQQGLDPEIILAGPGIERFRKQLGSRNRLAPEICWGPQAEFVGRFGIREAGRGRFSDPWTLVPFYIRRSAAEEKADLSNVESGG